MGDEAYALRIGPGFWPPSSRVGASLRPERQCVVCPHRRHPGRRPGIHCRSRWAMRLTPCGSARAFGRWIPGRRFASPGMTVPWIPPPLSSRAKTRDPLPQSMGDEAYGLRIDPGVWPLDPGRRFALPGMTVRFRSPSPSSRAKTRDPLRGRWAMRLTPCGSARAFGRWIPGRRFASPGMTVPWIPPPLSSRAKTRDPLPRSMDDEAYALRIGPGVRPMDPGSALRFARDDGSLDSPTAVIPGEDPGSTAAVDGRRGLRPTNWPRRLAARFRVGASLRAGRQCVVVPHRRHPGRRPGIHCRNGAWRHQLDAARRLGCIEPKLLARTSRDAHAPLAVRQPLSSFVKVCLHAE